MSNSNATRTLTCGADGGSITVIDAVADYTVMTADEKAQAAMTAVITSVSVPADGRPVVKIKVSERHGLGVRNLSTTAATWRFALLKRAAGVNGSANDTWVSYLAANDHSSASSETAAAANLVDHGDGSYDYRFAKVINGGPTAAGTTYEADKSHRLIVLLYASGNPFSPINLVKDFVPMTGADVTGQLETVDGNACLECHTTFRAISGGTGEFGSGEFHSGVRYDVRTCVGCHNDQRRFTSSGAVVAEPAIAADRTWTGAAAVLNGEAVINLPVFIHKIHMGTKLKLTGGSYAGIEAPYETTYPQDVRNCAKCHRAPAPLADHWKTQPSSRACGACHDDRSFEATLPAGRAMHTGGPQATDVGCSTCHQAGGTGGDTAAKHIPVSLPSPTNIYASTSGSGNTNAAYVAAAGAVPPGAKVVTYAVQSVSTWTDAAAANVLRPQIVFKFKVDGTDVVFPDPAAASELIPGFVGAPSAYFVFAVPQDGEATPADFNASASAYIRNIWNGTGTCSNAASTTTRTGAGTLTGPDAMGFYTLRLTCATIPANATMLTGGIGYTYGLGSRQSPSNPDLDFVNNTQPFTQINLARVSLRRQQEGGRRHARLQRRRRADRAAARRVGGRDRLHRPARHRRQQQVRLVPRLAGRRARLPRRPAQRRRHVQLVPPAQPDEQRVVGQRQGLRPRHPRRGEAHDAVHLAPGVADGGLLEGDLPGRAQQVRDVPPRRDVRLQHQRGEGRVSQHARQHRRAGDVRGRQRARALRERGDRLWRRLQLQRAHGGDRDPRSHDAGRDADGRGLRVMPRLAHRHRPHADQRRLVLRIARRRGRQAAAGGVHALPRPQPHRVHRRPPRVPPLSRRRSCAPRTRPT